MEGERKKEDKTARAGLVTESPPASVRGTKNGSDSRMILRRLRSTDLSHPATAIIFSAVTYENIRRDSTYIVCPSSLRAACSISVRCGLADSCWLCVRCLLHKGAVLAASASRIRLVRKAR